MAAKIIVANSFPVYLHSDKTNGQALKSHLSKVDRHSEVCFQSEYYYNCFVLDQG